MRSPALAQLSPDEVRKEQEIKYLKQLRKENQHVYTINRSFVLKCVYMDMYWDDLKLVTIIRV